MCKLEKKKPWAIQKQIQNFFSTLFHMWKKKNPGKKTPLKTILSKKSFTLKKKKNSLKKRKKIYKKKTLNKKKKTTQNKIPLKKWTL